MRSLLAILIAAASVNSAAAKPRVVSLDFCSDQFVLKLADPGQILALSRGADNDYSYMRATAAGHKHIRPTREEVLALAPDLVMRQWGGGANAHEAFGQFGAKVVSLGYPSDFDGVKENIRQSAQALDQTERGEALIRELDDRLNTLSGKTTPSVHALYVTPGGVTAGAHTMIDAIITAAGAINLSAARGQSYWPPLPIEDVILYPPEMIVAGFFISQDQDINHWSAARHPVIKAQFSETTTVYLTPDLISCAAWYSVEAAEMIADKLDATE